jgi:peptidoglycan/LPS O-acetylase OafA/YrhL
VRSKPVAQKPPKPRRKPRLVASRSAARVVPARTDALDGLRALAISLVIALHYLDSGRIKGSPLFRSIAAHGGFGVYLFFVLSGFLITQVLLREESATGRLSLKGFYFKRAFRILPPFLAVLFVTYVLNRAGVLYVPTQEFLDCLMMVRNKYYGSIYLGHFWSLSIEEQFYAFFPLLLILVRRWDRRVAVLTLLILSLTVWGMFALRASPPPPPWRTDLNLVWILQGCLLATLRQSKKVSRVLDHSALQSEGSVFAFLSLLVLSFSLGLQPTDVWLALGRTILVALLINSLLRPRGRVADRVFGSRPLVFIGKLSFGLYLWQQMFCREPHTFGFLNNWMILAVTFTCAFLSYTLLEKPALRLRNRILASPAGRRRLS